MPKTGTSVLQNAVVLLLKERRGSGLGYLATGRDGAVAHHALAERVRLADAAGMAALCRDIGQEMTIAAEAGQGPAIWFASSEAFTAICGHSTHYKFVDLAEGMARVARTDYVIYLRDYADFLESMYLQSSRFGGVTVPFEHYLTSRMKWSANLVQGLGQLRQCLPENFEVAYLTAGRDVLVDFDGRLYLPPGTLAEAVRTLPSTAKLSFKAQTLLSALPEFEAKLGFAINRNRLVEACKAPDLFNDDLAKFTLFSPEARYEAQQHFCRIAAEGGLAEYRDAFPPGSVPPLPYRPLETSAITKADLAVLRDLRPRIAWAT